MVDRSAINGRVGGSSDLRNSSLRLAVAIYVQLSFPGLARPTDERDDSTAVRSRSLPHNRRARQRIIALELELSKRRYEDPAWIGYLNAMIGENDEAFKWLEKGYEEKSDFIAYVKVDPSMKNLHSDPRYIELLKKMNLPL